jgi:hypothetical protein
MVNSLFSIQHSAFSISAALADITDETTKASWSWHPQLPIWALLPLFALAAAAAIYLYLAQQRSRPSGWSSRSPSCAPC